MNCKSWIAAEASRGVQLSDEEKGRELEINGITGFKVDCGPT